MPLLITLFFILLLLFIFYLLVRTYLFEKNPKVSSERAQNFVKVKVQHEKEWKEYVLYHELYGRGKIKVLFICGIATNHELWHSQIDYILQDSEAAEKYQICLFDNIGGGLSSIPKGFTIAPSLTAKCAIELVRHLGWEKFHVVGQSMGGLIVQSVALEILNLYKKEELSSKSTGDSDHGKTLPNEYHDTCENPTSNSICKNYVPQVKSIAIFNSFHHIWNIQTFPIRCTWFLIKCLYILMFKNRNRLALGHMILNQIFHPQFLDNLYLKQSKHEEKKTNRSVLLERYEKMFNVENFHLYGVVKQVLGIAFKHYHPEEDLAQLSKHFPILLVGSDQDCMVRPGATHLLHQIFSKYSNVSNRITSSTSSLIPSSMKRSPQPNSEERARKLKDGQNEAKKGHLRVKVFKGVGHITNVEKDDECNELLFNEWFVQNEKNPSP